MIQHRTLALVGALSMFAALSAAAEEVEPQPSPLRVFVVKKIVTMEPALPEATAVAVADGRIVSVGTLESLESWIEQRGAEIDRTLEDKVLYPGLIDPHGQGGRLRGLRGRDPPALGVGLRSSLAERGGEQVAVGVAGNVFVRERCIHLLRSRAVLLRARP